MTTIHVHHDDLAGGSVVARAFSWLGEAVTTIHHAFVAARLERAASELSLYCGGFDEPATDRDAARYPQRPMVLSDKWDF
jgi:hypothetical protein